MRRREDVDLHKEEECDVAGKESAVEMHRLDVDKNLDYLCISNFDVDGVVDNTLVTGLKIQAQTL